MKIGWSKLQARIDAKDVREAPYFSGGKGERLNDLITGKQVANPVQLGSRPT